LPTNRRIELGLSQSELAARAGLTQGKISRIEGSDTVPTLPLLAKLVKGLDASLNISIDAGSGAERPPEECQLRRAGAYERRRWERRTLNCARKAANGTERLGASAGGR
jgi:transcriptional regulator with XRE-family HTH domain